MKNSNDDSEKAGRWQHDKNAVAQTVEKTLNLFPEVTWDRWTGELDSEFGISVFGWLARQDGRSDFLLLRIDADGVWQIGTSSALHSEEFARRVGFTNATHEPCKRVENHFPNVNSVHL